MEITLEIWSYATNKEEAKERLGERSRRNRTTKRKTTKCTHRKETVNAGKTYMGEHRYKQDSASTMEVKNAARKNRYKQPKKGGRRRGELEGSRISATSYTAFLSKSCVLKISSMGGLQLAEPNGSARGGRI